MFGNYRNSGIYMLRSYAEAKSWHDRTEPIRGTGRNAGLRPLGHRGKMHFQIYMRDQDVICKLYDTDVVTFHPDNTITITDGGYTSQTTANFIHDVLGAGACIKDHDIVLFGSHNPTRLMKKMVVTPANVGYTVIETGKHYTYTINRKRMSELRKMVAPFMKYASVMIKLREGTFSKDEIEEAFDAMGMQYNTRINTDLWQESPEVMTVRMNKFLFMCRGAEDTGNWHNAFLWLGRSVVKNFWAKLIISDAAFKRGMDDVLIALHPDVLDITETPAGTIRVNKYARFKAFKEKK
jgi:hypothetical protein